MKFACNKADLYFSKNFFMKQAFVLFCSTTLLIACADQKEKATTTSEGAVVKSATATVTETAPDSATMMKNWQEYMEPGNEHKMMASWNGTWNTEMTMWMAPDAAPAKSAGTTINKMVLGGRYQQATHKGTWGGMPLEGISTLAYDNAKKCLFPPGSTTWEPAS
jgi:hypothetical protein